MTTSISKSVKKYKVCSVIITHNPTIESLNSLITSVTAQVDYVLIVDNDSNSNFQLLEAKNKVEIVRLPQNLGIAAAQNIGVAYATSRRVTHILFLDQDSLPSSDMVSRLLDVYNALHDRGGLVSAVGPSISDDSSGNRAHFIQLGTFKFKRLLDDGSTGFIPANILISSGSLIPIEVLEDVGFMDESLFIDLVDTEWFLRASAKGYRAFGVPDAIMYHSLGDKTRKVWFGRWRHVPQHKAFRHYYMFRNSFLLHKRDYIPLVWKLNNLVKLIYLLVFNMVFMPDRRKRFKMIARGIYDGLRGKAGKLECVDE